MKVTLIKYRNDSIKLITEDGREFILPVTSEYVKLAPDTDLSDSFLSKMNYDSKIFLCRRQLFKYISTSDKSTFECRHYLRKKNFDNDIIQSVITEFSDKNFINDMKFTENYIDFLKRTKTVGKNYVLNRLYMKEIDKSIIESLSNEIRNFDEDYEKIALLAEKKFKTVKKKNNIYNKMVYFLQSRGFSNSTIFRVLDILKEKGYDFSEKYNEKD